MTYLSGTLGRDIGQNDVPESLDIQLTMKTDPSSFLIIFKARGCTKLTNITPKSYTVLSHTCPRGFLLASGTMCPNLQLVIPYT
jgi:hypothetical protein